jgi:glyoxylase-like metal-dependent hydrolase (beta-lactamase superfamily II)
VYIDSHPLCDVPVQPQLYRHPHGITAIDTEYLHPGHAAAHLIVEGGEAAFVDVGTNHSVPYLLAALDELKIARASVKYLLLTHVHLDHAGGAGLLLQHLPNATAVLHPRGAPHLIRPAKLVAASKVVYGEERYAELYGELVPMPPERVRVVADGERVQLGARTLELLHTPGHAQHHYVIVDAAHRSIFSGDTFGLSYRKFDTAQGAFIIPTTTPTQFDPAQLVSSIERMMSYAPTDMYLMHFSRVTDTQRLARDLKEQIGEFVRIAERHAQAPDRFTAIRADMRRLWLARLRAHGVTLTENEIDAALGGDLDLNTQGLIAWLERLAKTEQS